MFFICWARARIAYGNVRFTLINRQRRIGRTNRAHYGLVKNFALMMDKAGILPQVILRRFRKYKKLCLRAAYEHLKYLGV